MSSAEGTHECEECETSYASKEELDKHNKEEHPEEWSQLKKWRCTNSGSSHLFLISLW